MRACTWFVGLALPCSGFASPAPAECIDYGDYLHWAGGVALPGNALGVALSGNLAYVADGVEGLQAIDIGDPLVPRWIRFAPAKL